MFNKNKIKKSLIRQFSNLKELISRDKKVLIGIALFIVFISVYSISKFLESNVVVYKSDYGPRFEKGRILNSPKSDYLKGRERQLKKMTKKMLEGQKKLMGRIDFLEKKIAESSVKTESKTKEVEKDDTKSNVLDEKVKYYPDSSVVEQTLSTTSSSTSKNPLETTSKKKTAKRIRSKGPSVISFPVKQKRVEEGIVLPTGSYVKAKLMTGIDAPEGKTYPVLLALDYSYVGPNKHRVDLSGCFMIAKTSPTLATERINFQATRLSCVSKKGKFFEKEINGFVADEGDNSFAVKAEVHSKQGRVAKMAFMKSIVDGVGEIITRKSKAIGGKNPDSANVMIQNGAQGAASKVSDWYLKQATSLLPTLSVGSGQDVWVIMQEKVVLPNDFFRKKERRRKDAKVYSYFGRAVD